MRKNVPIALLLIISNFLSYGLGQKHIHVVYANAYYEPTKSLFNYLKAKADRGDIESLAVDIKAIDSGISRISWRDEQSYRRLVEQVASSQ